MNSECLIKPSKFETSPLPLPTALPNLPAEMWRRIFQFLSPVQQWEVEDTFFEFQDAVSYDIDEVVALRKRAIDVFRGFQPGTFEPWLTQQGPDAKTYVIFLFSNYFYS